MATILRANIVGSSSKTFVADMLLACCNDIPKDVAKLIDSFVGDSVVQSADEYDSEYDDPIDDDFYLYDPIAEEDDFDLYDPGYDSSDAVGREWGESWDWDEED